MWLSGRFYIGIGKKDSIPLGWFYENNVGVERTKVKRMEMKALVDLAIAKENQLLSAKYEDSSL